LFPSGLARDLDLGTQQFLLPTRRSRSPPGCVSMIHISSD
jgi:hypothetical protein